MRVQLTDERRDRLVTAVQRLFRTQLMNYWIFPATLFFPA